MTAITDMIQELESEYDRVSLTAVANRAILAAVRHYERERFYFNEAVASWVTVANQEKYTFASLSLSDLVYVDLLKTIVNSTQYPLTERTYIYIEGIQTSDVYIGYPYDYAIHAESFVLYPIPNASYTCEVSYVKRIPASISACFSSSSVWTNEAYDLIMARARAHLDINYFRRADAVREQFMFIKEGCLSAQESVALNRLRTETSKKINTGKIMPWQG